jgi:hypothetical protein
MKFYVVEQAPLWGDCGRVLVSGYGRRTRAEGPLRLHRTGPFAPPIFFPWESDAFFSTDNIVVTGEFRRVIESQGLPGIVFREALKTRIVKLGWHEWDRSANEPRKYPQGGEPEDYVCDRKHSPAAAAALPPLWEVILPVIPCRVDLVQLLDPARPDYFTIELHQHDYRGWFWNAPHRYALVDQPTRSWLQAVVGEWVSFRETRAGKVT